MSAPFRPASLRRFCMNGEHSVARRRPVLVFWLSFAALDILLFLPLVLLNLDESWLVPWRREGLDAVAQLALYSLVERDGVDPFRLNLELLLLVTLWATVHWLQRPVYRLTLVAVYFATLAYAVYESLTLSIWQTEPVFYTHYFMAADGLAFLFDHLHLSALTYVGAFAILAIAGAAIYALLWAMTEAAGSPLLGRNTRVLLVLLTIVAVGLAATTRTSLASPTMTVSSLAAKLERNIDRSLEVYDTVRGTDDSYIRSTYNFSDYTLAETPDIYLIFVESYGSVLYKRDDYRIAYEALLAELESELAEGGWHSASTLSEAPTWGGGSWMSYTSALFGLRIEEHPAYLALVDRYQEADYPGLGQYLKSQGYRYLRVSSLATQLKDEEWRRYKDFFGVDEWLRYKDLGYVGQRYGWGPAPPDQYVLNFAQQAAESTDDAPRLLFYITQNSHYPWMPLPELVEDWRTLNVPESDQVATPDDELPHARRRRNYFDAIDYQLRFLTGFILDRDEHNAIFVLVGDHQPPRVSRKDDGWDTPMHIIAADEDFVAGFAEYGFIPGLGVDEITPTVRHEGFFTLFLRELLASYGVDPDDLPAYLPEGVVKLTNNAAGE